MDLKVVVDDRPGVFVRIHAGTVGSAGTGVASGAVTPGLLRVTILLAVTASWCVGSGKTSRSASTRSGTACSTR